MTSPQPAPPLDVFVSYCHRDEDFKDDLVIHLANLKRQGKIRAWQDRDIEAGAEWDAEIKQQLEAAEIILLLISARFIASDYCYDLELQRAIQRHDEGTARVIPILLKPCDWQETPFKKLQVLPKGFIPISQWPDRDEAFLNVAQGIRRAVESLHAKKYSGATISEPALIVAPYLPLFSTYKPATFTGRETETAQLTQILSSSCRILAITGMTGIGKTALAERVVANLTGDAATLPYYRFSLDDRSLSPDFSSSGAALLRTLGAEPTLEDQKDPANLLVHLLNRLYTQPCRLQIDSLERLLRGNEQEGWSEFCDPLWLDLLHQFLAGSHCASQLLLTSQDIPADLDVVASRYPQFWHCQTLQGLTADKQRELFQNLGFSADLSPTDQGILQQIGAFYDGHPLVLQVIADEMLQPPFHGNIARYAQHYATEFTDTANPTSALSRSRLFRRRVRQRVEQSLNRLPALARQMLCNCAVFRRPVPIAFWKAMLPTGDARAAFETLQDRQLVEYTPTSNDQLLVRQHNLIRSVARDLLKADTDTWQAAERQAAHLWLTAYEPAADASNLETVRGYLEAFDHYCEVEDWEAAKRIAWTHLNTPTQDYFFWQLGTWSYFREQAHFCNKQLDIARKMDDTHGISCALGSLGYAHDMLGQHTQAIDFYQQALPLAKEIDDLGIESALLGGLGNAHYGLGQYKKAIEFHQRSLTLARRIGDREGESHALSNLGLVYSCLEQYERAIDFHQQNLTVAQNIGYRKGEGIALANLGEAQLKLNQYLDSSTNTQAALAIFQEIGDRANEAEALKNLAQLSWELGEIEVAQQYCQQALALATELKIPLAAECEELWSKIENESRG